MSFQFGIQELLKSAQISIHIKNPGVDVDVEVLIDIPLSEEQAKLYISLGDNEKAEFLKKLIESTPNIKKDLQRKIQSTMQSQIQKNA
jgi:hypothetical protein